MKLCRFGDDRLGVVVGDQIHDVTEVQKEIRQRAAYDMRGDAVVAALAASRSSIEQVAKNAPAISLSQAKLLSPVARPSKVMAAPTNYGKHIEEMGRRTDIQHDPNQGRRGIGTAGIFLKSNSSVVGPSEGIPLRFLDRINEHEIELVVVIGKEGTNIPTGRARDYIAGYTIGLDMTLRGPEDRSFRKSIDGYSVVGPWMVTAEEIADPNDIRITLECNGQLRQTADTTDLIYNVERLIEFASSFYTLYPGDLYYTGTPHGVGPVKPGDILRAKCPQIGEFDIAVRAQST